MVKPKVVTLCGSTRFRDEFQIANYEESIKGNIVLSVGFYLHQPETIHAQELGCTPEQKIAQDDLHKRKIDLSDEVLVLNIGGYIGESTASEIAYAEKIGVPVRYFGELDDSVLHFKGGAMNKQHVENALEMWAEMNKITEYKYESVLDYNEDVIKCVSYYDSDDILHEVTIDHPFLHEIIKGLDAKQMKTFLDKLSLLTIEPIGNYSFGPMPFGWGDFVGLITATVDNILEALFEVDI